MAIRKKGGLFFRIYINNRFFGTSLLKSEYYEVVISVSKAYVLIKISINRFKKVR